MRWLLAAATLVAAWTFAPLGAQTATPAETVTLQRWAERVSTELERRMKYPALMGGQPFASGVVRVKFNCSESGRPDHVALLRSSGSGALDRAAVTAVQRIATLHPLPQGMAHDQRFVAALVFAADMETWAILTKSVRAEALAANSRFKTQVAAVGSDAPLLLVSR